MEFKKTLIATTAIVAVGGLSMATADAAKKPKLKISGYYEMYAGIGSGDRTGETAEGTPAYGGGEEGTFDIRHYGEIRFKVKGKADNGMKWGVYFEDVQNDQDDDGKKVSTDEANLWMSGTWGKLELGGQDGPGDKVFAGAEKLPHISPGMIGAFTNTSGFADEKMSINDSGDDTKITYYTPRVSGFQAGASWAPHDEKGSTGGDAANEPASEVSLEYKGKVGGGKIRATFGGAYLTTDNSATDPEFGWRAGVTYGTGPWTVAAGYRLNNNEGEASEDGDRTGWDLGVAYSGGRYEVALIYQAQKAEDSGGDADYYHVGLTGAYNLGKGLTLAGALYMYDLDVGSGGIGGSADTNGTVGVVALRTKF